VLKPSFCAMRLTNKLMMADRLSIIKSCQGWLF
jgi:hypothetical protein